MDSGHHITADGEEVLNPNDIYVREMNPNLKLIKEEIKIKKISNMMGINCNLINHFLGKIAQTSLKVFCYHTCLLTS